MALNYLREYSLGLLSHTEAPAKCKKPFSKKKFFVLFPMNLMIWLCVSGFYTGTSLASVSESVQGLFKQRELVITGVVCNSKMQAAIISNEICKVGDTVQGYTVIAISKYCVELKKGEKLVSKRMVLLN